MITFTALLLAFWLGATLGFVVAALCCMAGRREPKP